MLKCNKKFVALFLYCIFVQNSKILLNVVWCYYMHLRCKFKLKTFK